MIDKTESVRIDKEVLCKVRTQSEKLGMTIKIFIERAINEKLNRFKKKSNEN